MGVELTGTPVTGYVSLNSGALGPLPFALTVVRGQAAYTLGATEKIYIIGLVVSTNDSAAGLVTIDDGAIQTGITVVTKLFSIYPATNQQINTVSLFAGYTKGVAGVVPRATAAAVTSAKTIECMLYGYISRT